MSPDIVEAVKRLIGARSPDLDELVLSWFGGEPMLELETMLNVSAYAYSQAQANKFAFLGAATTNAWFLDSDLAAKLLAVGITQYQITLDGPPRYHDLTRVTAGGRGTFNRVWHNLEQLHASNLPVQVMIRCHVTPDNANAWTKFAPEVITLCDDGRFTVHVHKVGRWGGSNDSRMRVASVKQLQAVESLFAQVAAPVWQDICYAAAPSAFVVRADGSLARCTVAVNDPRNKVGELLPDGTMQIDQTRVRPWLKGWEGNEQLLACPLLGLGRRRA